MIAGRMRAVAATVALLVALAATGCSAGEGVEIGDVGSTENFLRVAIAGEPDQLDPHRTTSYFSFQVLENVFDTLVAPDAKLEMQPELARSWKVSADQLTWTFALRRGVKFHDGSAFTAADVVYSYNRIIDEELANAAKFASVKEVRAVDDYTVVIELSQPTPNLLSNLGGFKGMAIVSKRNVTSGKITTAPVGTGPFELIDYVGGDRILLRANPDYWGGKPTIAGVEYRFISEPSTALAALRSGDVDWTDNVPSHQVEALSDDDALQVGVAPSSDYWYLALNGAKDPWSDVRVRQAVAYAIDRDAIIEAVSFGTAQPNQLAIPAASDWYFKYDKYSTDLDRARTLLAEAGFSGGKLELLATGDYPETITAAQVIADNLSKIGIDVSIRQLDFSTWLDEQNSGNFDMLMMGWLGNIDPDDFYYAQHHSKGTSNAQGYSNPKVDRLLDRARAETDRDTRAGLYAQAATIIADEASYIYLYNPSVVQAWSRDVGGYEVRPDRAIEFDDVSLKR